MRTWRRYCSTLRSIAAAILLGMIACAASGCGPVYGYDNYPSYGYAPYSWGWGEPWGYYNPDFVVEHPWEHHHDYDGHHTEFYHGGGEVGREGGGFHGAGGSHGGGGGGGHGGGGHR